MSFTVKRVIDVEAMASTLFSQHIDNTGWQKKLRALSQAITLIENEYSKALDFLARVQNAPQRCQIIGITGLPGAGKSSLTNELLNYFKKGNKKIAVFAVDPSSQTSGGAFLGDRVRLYSHTSDPHIYIRSMASRGALGGVARATRGAIKLAAHIGFDCVVVETVGIGQSESAILDIADSVGLVLMPQSGDEIQLMKAGILERCPIYIVNKSDLFDPTRMVQEIQENTHPSDIEAWVPRVLPTSVRNNSGLEAVAVAFSDHWTHLQNVLPALRRQRLKKEILDEAAFLFEEKLAQQATLLSEADMDDVLSGKVTAEALAIRLFNSVGSPQ